MYKIIPPEVIKELNDKAKMAKMMADLINVHNKLLESIDTLNKKGEKGDKGDSGHILTHAELLDLIRPLAKEYIKEMMPEAPKLPSIETIVNLLKPHIQRKDKTDLKLLAKQVLTEIKLPKPKDPEITHEMLMEVLKKKKISVDMIEGLDKVSESHFDTLLRRRGLPHGGGDTLKAGANVTLTRNSDGTVTVTSSGGSGFSTLSATETPNGVITVFTFASAVAQPSFILSDNVLMRATTKSGGTNWTWDNLNKQATMTIPPTDDILAVT